MGPFRLVDLGLILVVTALSSVLGQVATVTPISDAVCFSPSGLTVISGLLAAMTTAAVVLFRSLLASKQETIALEQRELDALRGRVSDALRDKDGVGQQIIALLGSTIRETNENVSQLKGAIGTLNDQTERRHNELLAALKVRAVMAP